MEKTFQTLTAILTVSEGSLKIPNIKGYFGVFYNRKLIEPSFANAPPQKEILEWIMPLSVLSNKLWAQEATVNTISLASGFKQAGFKT